MNVYDTIDAIAVEKKIKRADILKEALDLYLEEWFEYKAAIERLKDPGDEVLSEEEFFRELREDLNWKV